jgi:SAM-dependent methyltransferase
MGNDHHDVGGTAGEGSIDYHRSRFAVELPPMFPARTDLEELVVQKYGNERGEVTGWGPRQRSRFGYYLPGDVYEALIGRLVFPGCSWIDIGGGRQVFPDNPRLATELVSRCASVVAVDPSPNVHENMYVHERVQSAIEDYKTDQRFDLATFRMVVEHVDTPDAIVRALNTLLLPGGLAVVFTINRSSPISLVSRALPFRLHGPIKRLFWGGDDKDTFPVRYKMNSRSALLQCFSAQGFDEAAFAYLDDLSTWLKYRRLNYLELETWRLFHALGLTYPENCLLGIYRKR